ncbi:MAG: hypothetical protein IT379_24145 [Deltaproteobacteria bacterium]|nr:hypothetical protein [Deltaproteobacteria bacterium]
MGTSIDPARRRLIADLVRKQLAVRPRKIRNLSLLMLVLCAVVAGILVSVVVSGAEGSGDVLVPALFAVGCALFAGGFLAWSLRPLDRHELLVALLATPPRIAYVERVTLWYQGFEEPALSFQVQGGGEYLIPMDELTRQEVIEWLGERRHDDPAWTLA